MYNSGESGRCLMVETVGAGAGWLDYDADGHWDLYLNQGGDATRDPDERQPNDALFRNLGDGTFQNVTDWTGIVEHGYSQGVAVGDYDNDGFDDVYVTNLLRNTLFHNLGDGTFQEVTDRTGVDEKRWSVTAAWGDLDLDGDLDLYVANYCIYDTRNPPDCRDEAGRPAVCHPRDIPPWPDECYFNQGDGTFLPESRLRGLVADPGRGLGVAIADLDNNGWPDVFVTNDTTANFLFINEGGGRFKEMAVLLGCAADRDGVTQANMGVTVSDFDRNGLLDLYVTHFERESNTLYRNYGELGFQDETGMLGLHGPTLDKLSFGVLMADYNQDGYDDVFITSGHIENQASNPNYRMQPQLFTYTGKRWLECTQQAGEFFREKRVGRAVAGCDYDEDGDLDLAVGHENTPTALLRNDSQRGHWLKFLFRGRRSNRRGINTRVTVQAGTSRILQELCGGTSYVATHQPALLFGLGEWDKPCTVTVRWPLGAVQTLERVAVDQTLVLDEPVEGR